MKNNLIFELNGEALSKINLIAKREGLSEDEVIKKALTLYTQIKTNKVIDNSKVYFKDKKGNMYKIDI